MIKVMRRIYEGYEIGTNRMKKMHIEQLHKLHYSQNIIRVMKSRETRWAKYVVRRRKTGNA
jgi:hypothetical protein